MHRVIKRAGVPVGLVLGTFRQHRPRPIRLPAGPLDEAGDGLPSIGVVMPSYRQAAFIERSIESVVSQRYPALTFTVQDGGSDDGTVEILQRFAERGELTYESRPDRGQAHAVNIGLNRVGGEIVGWLNSDDLYLPGALHAVGRHFRDHPDVDVVYGHRIVVDPHGDEVGRWVLPEHSDAAIGWRCYVTQETLFWRRSLLDEVGPLDESFRFALDWDLVARFTAAGAKFDRLPRFLGGFTTHREQKSRAWRHDVGEPEFQRIRDRHLPTARARTVARLQSTAYLLASIPAYWRYRNG